MMTDKINTLLKNLRENKIPFSNVIALIDAEYNYTPMAFKNGETLNLATQNQGSAKVFSFAKLNNLSSDATLFLFAEHYQAVLTNPTGNDHQNIRQFIDNGWSGIEFEGEVLVVK